MASNVLSLTIRVDDRDANRAIDKVNRGFSSVGKTGGVAGKEATIGLTGIDLGLKSLVGRLAGAYAGVKTLEKGFEFIKNSTQYAARTEQLGFALNAVARGANLSVTAVNTVTGKIAQLGFTTQSARQSLSRLIAANIDYRQSLQLARLSQDLGRVSGIASTEAYDRLVHAIVTLQPEMLRTLGLTVSLERAYKQHAKQIGRNVDDLTEQEKRQVAVNTVLQAGTAYQNVYTESAKTAGGQVLSMQRYFEDLKQEIGDRFLPIYTKLVGGLAEFLKSAKENIKVADDWATVLGKPFKVVAQGLSDFKSFNDEMKRLSEEQQKQRALANGGRQVGNTVYNASGLPVNGTYKETQPGISEIAQGLRGYELAGTLFPTKETDKASVPLQVLGREMANIALSAAQQGVRASAQTLKSKADKLLEQAQEAAKRLRDEQAKAFAEKQKQTLVQSRQLLEQAQVSELQGLQKINRERQIALRDMGLTAEAQKNITAAFDIQEKQERQRLADLQADVFAKNYKDYLAQQKDFQDAFIKATIQRIEFEKEVRVYRLRTEEDVIAAGQAALTQEKDAKIAQLGVVARSDIAGKLAIEEQKLRIEKEYIERSLALSQQAAQTRAKIEIENNPKFRQQIEEDLQKNLDAIQRSSTNDRTQAELRAQNEQQRIVISAWEGTYDRVKRSAEGVFDALTSRSKSFGEYLKTGMLTILKEIVTSAIARQYMALFGGGGLPGTPGFGGTGAGRGGGILGALGLSLGGGGFGYPGAPGGTPGFAGPIGAYGNGGGGGGLSGLSGFAGYKGLLSRIGNIGFGAKGGDFGGEVAGSFRGIGGAGGGALLLGGGALAAAGLRRGGLSGLGMTAAGGALIGLKFGGPIGALIGGAIGAGAGLVRLFIKGAEQKTKEKIKAFYGIDVKDKGILQQIVQTTKTAFGGNTDVAIRSPQIRDLLELYAMSTGQKFGLNPDTVRPSTIVQSGGQIFQQVSYDAGRAYTQQSSLPTLGGGTQPVQIIINGQSAAAALQGEAVTAIVQNPRAVTAATSSAQRSNYQRREVLARGLRPQILTA